MFGKKKYTWSEDEKRQNDANNAVKRFAAIVVYALLAWIISGAALAVFMHRMYDTKVAFYQFRAAYKIYFTSVRQYRLHGAVLTTSYFITSVWVIFAALFHYIFRVAKWDWLGEKDKNTSHGSAHFATEEEIRQAGLINDEDGGVVLCRWSPHKPGFATTIRKIFGKYKEFLLMDTGPDHNIVNAPTRAGKGISNVIPTLLTWKHSAVILDIKGENWLKTSGYRCREMGQYCLRFEPTFSGDIGVIKTDIEEWVRKEHPDWDELHVMSEVNRFYKDNKENLGTARWNPLVDVHIGTKDENAEVQNIATMLADPEGKGLEDYWAKTAFSLLQAAITYELYKAREERKTNPRREASLKGVREILSNIDENLLMSWIDNHFLKDDEEKTAFNTSADAHPLLRTVGNSMIKKAEEERSGVVGTATSNLELFLDSVIGKNTSNGTFRIDNIVNADRPVSLYLVVPPRDLPRLRPLIRLFMVLLINSLTAMMKKDPKTGAVDSGHIHRLLLLLDEFPQLKKMDQIQVALAQMAGYGLKAYLIIQSYTQLESEYGKEQTVSANCNVQIAFAPNDENTAKTLSDMCGKKTEIEGHMSESVSGGGLLSKKNVSQSTSYSEHERPLMYPDEIRRLPAAEKDAKGMVKKPGAVLVFPKGFPPIMGIQALYFKDKEWSRRSKILAPLISINIKDRMDNMHDAVRKWQLDNSHKTVETSSVEYLIAHKKEDTVIAQIPDSVLKKNFDVALRYEIVEKELDDYAKQSA